MISLQPKEIFEQLTLSMGDAVAGFEEDTGSILIDPSRMKDVALHLRDEQSLRFDSLMCLSGVDYGDNTLGAVYHLYSMQHRHKLTLKAKVPKDNPVIQTVEKVWRTADWHEREAYDLIGIIFEGHSDLRRILCPYDWEGHPLRKDYRQPEYYNGMKVPY